LSEDSYAKELLHTIPKISPNTVTPKDEKTPPTTHKPKKYDYIDIAEEARLLNTPNCNWRDLQRLYNNIPDGM
jgi:hypothetical protein